MPGDDAALRIGEFARRVGVSAELLRAWERRYGLLRPLRSPGGFRLYTDEDAARVARMRGALADGMSAAEAARVALHAQQPTENLLEQAVERMLAGIRDFDENTVHSVLDDSLAAFGLETVLRELVLPVLAAVGVAWEEGNLDVSHEHFASNLIRGRLLALARLWGRGAGPLALLACAPGEEHDISLLAFGLVLRTHGWRILFLGADTPTATVRQTAAATHPALVVLGSFDPALLESQAADLLALGAAVPLAIAGPGASDELGRRLGIRALAGDPVAAANGIARARP